MINENPFAITPAEVESLTNDQLVALLNRLIENRILFLSLPIDSARTTLRLNDADGGIDATVNVGTIVDEFLGCGYGVWQFKKTYPSDRAKKKPKSELELELEKPGVQNVFGAGGGYTLVIGKQQSPGQPGQLTKFQRLEELAHNAGCKGQVRLLFADHVARWATQDPTALLSIRPAVRGLRSAKTELESQRHGATFEADPQRETVLEDIGRRLLGPDPVANHIRIQGKAGVGKSRLALEAVQQFGSSESVFYTSEPVTPELFDWVTAEPKAQVTLIADESEQKDAERYVARLEQAAGRIRLITVGPGDTTGPDIHVLNPLTEEAVERIIRTETGLSDERARWVARKTRGFVKLAVLVAKAINRGTSNIAEISSDAEIARLIENLLASNNRERDALRGISLLTRVGIVGEVATEGQTVADFLGLDLNTFRSALVSAQKQGIVTKRGRYFYLSPELLAIWLAGEVWQAQADRIVEFQMALPSTSARQAFMQRLASLQDIPEVERIVSERLLGPTGPFRTIDDVSDDRASRLYSTLAKTHHLAALDSLERIIGDATNDQLLAFHTGRQDIVWTLRSLIQYRDTFLSAARLLRRLAENENETHFSNNATDYWNKIFLVLLGQTEMPALERIPVIDEALDSSQRKTRMLGISALSSMLDSRESAGIEQSDEVIPPIHWQPRTWLEVSDIRLAALQRLVPLLMDTDTIIAKTAREALCEHSRGLVQIGLAHHTIEAFRSLRINDEGERRKTWQAIRSILINESPRLSSIQSAELEALARNYYDDSLIGQMKRYLGVGHPANWDREDFLANRHEEAIARLADEAVATNEWTELLPWLVSGDAHLVYLFARRLGQVDNDHKWLPTLIDTSKSAPDPRLLAFYLAGWASLEAEETNKVDRLLDEWSKDPKLTQLVADTTFAIGPSETTARRLLVLIRHGLISPSVLSGFRYGTWMRNLPPDLINELLECLLTDGTEESIDTGLALAVRAHDFSPETFDDHLIESAWRLLEAPAGWAAVSNTEYHWNEVAKSLVYVDPRRMIDLMARLFSTVRPTFDDPRLLVLRQALEPFPEDALERLTPLLTTSREKSWVHWGLRELDFFEHIEFDVVEAWVERHGLSAVEALTDSVRVEAGEMSPLVRFLLNNHFETASGSLAVQFRAGSWIGSEVAYLMPKLESVKLWTKDGDPSVRKWAAGLREWLNSEIVKARQWEEEEWWY